MARKLRRMFVLAMAIWLTVPWLGCGWHRARHGLILRGDWSLEVNRVPWGRTTVQQACTEEACATECEEDCGPAPAVNAVSGGPCGPSGHCGPLGAGGCRACRKPLRGEGGSPAAVAQAGYYNHPRFHPVPTRPVFSPQPNLADPAVPAVIPDTAVELQAPTAPMPAPLPQPEAIPAPAGNSSSQWRSKQGRTTTVASREPSWIFTPAAEPTPVGPEIRSVRQPQPAAKPLR